jgi:hypothetical protein
MRCKIALPNRMCKRISKKVATEIRNQGPYSQHIIFFVTYEWDQKARVFVLGKPLQACVT